MVLAGHQELTGGPADRQTGTPGTLQQSERAVTHSRRRFLSLACGSAVMPLMAAIARAQAYPSRPVHIVVGFAAGGTSDIGARLIGQKLQERLGQPFVIDNRPGAATNLATETVVHATPDGYTLLMVGPSSTINATLYNKLSFVFLRDIAPVASVFQQPQILVANPSLPAKTVPELIAYAKANPGKVTIASAGTGSSGHLAGEMFKMMAGIDMLHVPYRGAGPALTDLLGGQVLTAVIGLAGAIEHVKSGKLRALAVTTAARAEALPEVPTVGEFLPGYEASDVIGVCAPGNTPAAIVNRLNREVNAALADPAMKARFADLGGAALPLSPTAYGKILADETEKWGKVIRAANIQPE
jgi:tripartite-type tricarboxylate transporter receptor subunit TctC